MENGVNQVTPPEVSEDLNTQTQAEGELVATPPVEPHVPGSQTPSENLLAALKEERAKVKELEDKINNLTAAPLPEDSYSEEGRMLSERIKSLEDQIELSSLQSKFPQLKELSPEFQDFRKEYPRHKGENVAKLFLAEKGFMESPRKGLENPTGGPRTPQSPDMTAPDIERLRKTDFRKYSDMVKKGLIKI